MQHLSWNSDKNQQLIDSRGVSFEDVSRALREGRLLDDRKHPNSHRYPLQRIFVVEIRDYVYLVPYVDGAGILFLKTIIPSRKATRDYLGGGR